jgi:hypothetical protein
MAGTVLNKRSVVGAVLEDRPQFRGMSFFSKNLQNSAPCIEPYSHQHRPATPRIVTRAHPHRAIEGPSLAHAQFGPSTIEQGGPHTKEGVIHPR